MGTSIDCFFARERKSDAGEIEAALRALSVERADDIRAIQTGGRFSTWDGEWWVHPVESSDGDPASIEGEGTAGFHIQICSRVVRFGSIERFRSIYDSDIAISLRRVITAVSLRLGTSSRIAVAAAGFGDTDRAGDVAYYGAASFDQVCEALEEVAGPPARTWSELAEDRHRWYLGESLP